jgi:hypothetical protein
MAIRPPPFFDDFDSRIQGERCAKECKFQWRSAKDDASARPSGTSAVTSQALPPIQADVVSYYVLITNYNQYFLKHTRANVTGRG